MRANLRGITPNTLPKIYHVDFCGCNSFYTNPLCLKRYKERPNKNKDRVGKIVERANVI